MLTINMTNKGKRQVSYQLKDNNKKGDGRGGSMQENQGLGSKKDRNPAARHSYHQTTNNFLNGHTYDNNVQYDEHRSFVMRERSFVRPMSSSNLSRSQGGQIVEELQRQRSFVHPGQLQQQSQGREQQYHSRRKSVVMQANQRGKPAMEIYRPPTLRSPNGVDANGEGVISNCKGMNGMYDSSPAASHNYYINNSHNSHNNSNHPTKKSGLNIHAKEFVSYQILQSSPSGLQHSKSSSNVYNQHGKHQGLQHSKSGHNLQAGNGTDGKNQRGSSPPKVHFHDEKENGFESKSKTGAVSRPSNLMIGPTMVSSIKRSKSLGSADLRHIVEGGHTPLADIGPFSQDAQTSISNAMNDPNALSARQLMEVVRHIFTRVLEASRYSETTARICITIVEKETGETFLETLLNTCQEYFQERDKLLRCSQTAPYPGYVSSHPKWIAYMSFLNEMYTQLKRRHVQLMTRCMKNSETAPGLLLLTLLAQCCQICLKENSVNSLAETECLFFVLTAVGKDIEVELPQQMVRVMAAARDAFLTTVRVPAVRKTLLQLIEMHAARWQLPAPAVMYYYPGSGAK